MRSLRRAGCGALLLGMAALTLDAPMDAQSTTVAAALQRGITLMDTRGDCAAAQPHFEIAAGSGDTALASQALYLSGRCHERAGDVGAARRAYERLVARYPRAPLAKDAQQRISGLRGSSPAGVSKDLTMRRLGLERVPPNGSVSRDGRYFTAIDDRGQWARLDAVSGRQVPLSVAEAAESPWFALLSPSGRQVALTVPNEQGRGDLLLATVGVGAPAMLVAAGPLQAIKPAAWSADARRLLVVTTDPSFRVALAMVEVGQRRMTPLLDLGTPEPLAISMTSDGGRVLFDHATTRGQRDIRLLDVATGRVESVVSGRGNDVLPAWLPGDRAFLFASDRLGPLSLWLRDVRSGGEVASETLVRRDIGRIWPVGVTSSGTFIHGLQTGMMDVHVAKLGEHGVVAEAPTALSMTWAGNNQAPDWSPDGRWLAYASLRGAVATGDGMRAVVIRELATGQERLLHPDMLFLNAPRWSSDGTRLLVKGRSAATNRWGAFIMDARTAAITPLITADQMNDESTIGPHQWVPGREAVLVGLHGRGIVEVDVATGAQTVIVPLAAGVAVTAGRGCAYGPDGRTLAYSVRERVATGRGFETVLRVRLPDGSLRELLREPAVALMSWAPDGGAVYVVRYLSATGGTQTVRDELWRIPLDGSTPTFAGIRAPSLRGVSVHPDGRTVAYVTGFATWEIWAMEGIR